MISTLLSLARSDIGQQTQRLKSAVVYGTIAAIAAVFFIAFATAALAVWLAQLIGLPLALLCVSFGFLAVAIAVLVINKRKQAALRRRLAQSAVLQQNLIAGATNQLARNHSALLPLALFAMSFVTTKTMVDRK